MVGDKPDERIRTPMQWSPRRGLGFTTGTPWQAAQPDSFTVTVDAQAADPNSLLTLYRRLIHLRKANAALATGELVQLTASHPGVVAYVRRAGDRAVLVVANLSGTEAPAITITSSASVVPARTYAVRNLLGGPEAGALTVGGDGQLRAYQALSRPLGAGESLILELVPR